jgi:hypothetical protein
MCTEAEGRHSEHLLQQQISRLLAAFCKNKRVCQIQFIVFFHSYSNVTTEYSRTHGSCDITASSYDLKAWNSKIVKFQSVINGNSSTMSQKPKPTQDPINEVICQCQVAYLAPPLTCYNHSWVDQNLNFVKINVMEYILLCYAYSEHVLTRKAIMKCRTF